MILPKSNQKSELFDDVFFYIFNCMYLKNEKCIKEKNNSKNANVKKLIDHKKEI